METEAQQNDAILVNRDELARAFNVSLPTIDRWIADGMPVRQRGSNGRPYLIDPAEVRTWRKHVEAAEVEADRKKQAAIADMQAELDLDAGETTGADALPFKARREYYAAELERMRVAKQRGQLVDLADMRRVNAKVFVFLSDRLQSLPDYLERQCSLSPDIVGQIADQIDLWQSTLADELEHEIAPIEVAAE